MNKDQAAAAIKALVGKAQALAGEVTGNKRLRAKGLVVQGEARMQKALGDVKIALSSSRHK